MWRRSRAQSRVRYWRGRTGFRTFVGGRGRSPSVPSPICHPDSWKLSNTSPQSLAAAITSNGNSASAEWRPCTWRVTSSTTATSPSRSCDLSWRTSLGPERFLREIQIVAKLQHPHILGLIDSGDADGMLYYVMPYVTGETLRTRLAREGEFPISEAVWVLREIADALAHAHAHQIIHRDIKPENVMFSSRHALVADFGIARAVTEAATAGPITATGIVVGSPAYMAPEQASSDPQMDHRADIYAFGVLAYEVITGVPPFTAPSAVQLVSAHMMRPPEPLTRHRPGIPEALEDIGASLPGEATRGSLPEGRRDCRAAGCAAHRAVERDDGHDGGACRGAAQVPHRRSDSPDGSTGRCSIRAWSATRMEYLDNHARSDTLVCFVPGDRARRGGIRGAPARAAVAMRRGHAVLARAARGIGGTRSR